MTTTDYRSAIKKRIDEISMWVVENATPSFDSIIIENGETAHVDFAILLVQSQYKKQIKAIERSGSRVTDEMKRHSFIVAKQRTIEWLMEEGHDLIDRTIGFLFQEAQQTGWFNSDYFGWKDLEDMISSTIDKQDPGGPSAYAWLQYSKNIIPAAKQAGIDPSLLLATKTQVRKVRNWLLPGYSHLVDEMKAGNISQEEGQKDLRWLIGMAANPDIKSAEMEKKVNVWRGKNIERREPMEGVMYILPEGRTMFVVIASNSLENKVIENALRGITDLKTQGSVKFVELAKEVIGLTRRANDT